jgi:light-regulated signal transduction histidine kinase (bacteriophytochrome)
MRVPLMDMNDKDNAELMRCRQESMDFAYKVSHDLQAPIRSIIGFSNFVASSAASKLTEQEKEDLAMVISSAEHARDLIEALLTYCKLSNIAHAEVAADSNAIMADVVTAMRKEIDASGARITYDNLPMVMADPHQLRVVFNKLLCNAIIFRDKGTAPLIHISAEPKHDSWVFSIKDNGIGIDPKYHETVFDVLKKLHAPEDYPGLGMGLAMVKKIVEQHKGSVGIVSALGEGTTVNFSLPAVPL